MHDGVLHLHPLSLAAPSSVHPSSEGRVLLEAVKTECQEQKAISQTVEVAEQ